jgi:hypothetical protein
MDACPVTVRSILERFFSGKENPDGLDQAQRKATIDPLLLCMYADNDLDLNEERIINRVSQRYASNSETTLDNYISGATARVEGISVQRMTGQPSYVGSPSD